MAVTATGMAARGLVLRGSAIRPLLSGLQSQHLQTPSIASRCTTSLQPRFHSTVPSPASAQGEVDKAVKQDISDYNRRDFDKGVQPSGDLKHFRPEKKTPPQVAEFTDPTMVRKEQEAAADVPPVGTHSMPHPIWSEEEVHDVVITHRPPEGIIDRLALLSVKTLRTSYDAMSGYNRRLRDERIWLNRICFLETVAGVPGMVGAMVRHLNSLRRMKRDHGWIHTLLEEAENERMHLMTAMYLKQPSLFFRTSVVTVQAIFVSFFSLAYLVSPRYCHRFVGYLEEEAVKTYTKCLEDIDSGAMQHWQTQPAPDVALRYWSLHPHATMKDVILAIRADEAHHRIVNHTLSSMRGDEYNPYKPGE